MPKVGHLFPFFGSSPFPPFSITRHSTALLSKKFPLYIHFSLLRGPCFCGARTAAEIRFCVGIRLFGPITTLWGNFGVNFEVVVGVLPVTKSPSDNKQPRLARHILYIVQGRPVAAKIGRARGAQRESKIRQLRLGRSPLLPVSGNKCRLWRIHGKIKRDES